MQPEEQEITYIRELSGHSGCKLKLFKDTNTVFLRKESGSISYNNRLKKQYIKQKKFHLDGIKTPKVLKYGYNAEGLFYFDMEFINGITMAEHMRYTQIKEISNLIDLLFCSLKIKEGKLLKNSENIFKKKINSLKKICDKQNPIVQYALEKLQDFNFSEIPFSPCCGDLTLENILLSSSGIYVIDLLDSFYSSWMVDVAKLLQDIELGWTYRFEKRNYNLNLRLAIAKKQLLDRLSSLKGGPKDILMIYYLLLLNLIRIYPYSHDKPTIDFLDKSLKKVINKIEKMEK